MSRRSKPLTPEDKAFYDSFVSIDTGHRRRSIPLAVFMEKLGIDPNLYEYCHADNEYSDRKLKTVSNVVIMLKLKNRPA